jgi:hypothetical protein
VWHGIAQIFKVLQATNQVVRNCSGDEISEEGSMFETDVGVSVWSMLGSCVSCGNGASVLGASIGATFGESVVCLR